MKILFTYCIQINMKNGSKKFVSIGRYARPAIVSTPTKHCTFLTSEMAQWVSDRFWEMHWDSEIMETREIKSTIHRGQS